MSDVILKVENLSKQYRLGTVGTGTISHDLNRWWYKIRGKEDPYLKIGETNDRSKKGQSDYAWALRDINFEVKRGEVLGIIGKNGAGKSTLLKILSRVTSPTTGEIKTKGRIASLLEVGTGFHPELTGRENIYLNGAILGMTKAEITSKEQEIIEFSGCERYIDTPVKRYSSGMRVRLAFAVAAHLEPDILVVDEVLAVGDAEFQKKAIGKMQDISKGEGRTVLFVSHDMTAIRSLCPKVLLLENGSVKQIGQTDSVITNYLKLAEAEVDRVVCKSKYVESFTIRDHLGNEVRQNLVPIGSNINFFIKLKDNIEEKLDYCFLGVENLDQKRVFSVGTHLDSDFNSVLKPSQTIICTINSLNIIQGSYKVLLVVGTNLPRENKEVIRDALFFEVYNDNFFENGANVLKAQGEIIFKPKWTCIPRK